MQNAAEAELLEDVARLSAVFEGFDGAHGTYDSGSTAINALKAGKVEIKATARTKREPVTAELWLQHVRGQRPLGVIPIRADDSCLWGCVDVDVYDVSHAALVQQISERKLPLVVCTTKSGGAHLFLFLREAVPAEILQARLREMAAVLGHGTAEIFPKQKTVALDRNDLGSWLNMPYFGGDDTTRHGVKVGGAAMTLPEFLDAAERARLAADVLIETSYRKARRGGGKGARGQEEPVNGNPEFGDGPPCLQHLTVEGFPDGTRNKGLFALGVFCKKKYGQNWAENLERMNHQYVNPPLNASEVVGIVKSLQKKDYHYTCREHPLCDHCNSSLCAVRRFGVGNEEDYPRVEGVSVMKTDPPLWFADVSGVRLELTTEQLMNYTEFRRVCFERLFVLYKPMKSDRWTEMVMAAVRDAVEIDAPTEASKAGQFYELLEDFLTDRHRGTSRDELLLGKAVLDEENGKYWFRLRDLEDHLTLAGFKVFNRPQLTARIRALQGTTKFMNVKGKGFHAWCLDERVFTPTPALELPAVQVEPI